MAKIGNASDRSAHPADANPPPGQPVPTVSTEELVDRARLARVAADAERRPR